MTAKQRWENYWYHYKWHTVIALFLVFTLAVGITQCALRPRYDQNAVLYCDRVISDRASEALAEALSRRIADSDGDGTPRFEVYNVAYSSQSKVQQTDFANAQKIMALVSSADYVLYIVDSYGYDRLMLDDNMQLFEACGLPHKEGTAWNWQGSPLQAELAGAGLPEELFFCVRKVAGTAAERNADAAGRAQQALALINALMAE